MADPFATPGSHSVGRTLSEASLQMLVHSFVMVQAQRTEDSRAGLEALSRKLDVCGYDVGRRFTERLTRDKDRIVDILEIIKFLCRVFWKEAFQHQVDKLQTNHKVACACPDCTICVAALLTNPCPQGVYVLVDNSFAWTRYCSAPEGQDTKLAAAKFLAFPSGMIRGALAAFGLDCVVSADIGVMPQCTFTVKIKG